jgi:hypothetical protein
MRCIECGYQNDAGVKSCIKCGTSLSESQASQNDPVTIVQPDRLAGASTIRGNLASDPYWDKPEIPDQNKPLHAKESPADSFICSSCKFHPLRVMPSSPNPCPNCGYNGINEGGDKSSAKTVKINEVNVGSLKKTPRITLIDQTSKKEISFEGETISINRDQIDPSNNSISSKEHIIFHYSSGKFFVEDKSSNQASFIQITEKAEVPDGTLIIIGDKMFMVITK